MAIPEGYGLIAGRSRQNAQAALDAAEKAGVPISEVRSTNEGYVVPDAVLEAYSAAAADVTYVDGSKPPVDENGIPVVEEKTPDEGWKNADIEDWADERGIDLGGASKKADMLAAIAAAGNP